VLLTNTVIAGGATGTAQALLATATLDPASIAATAQAIAATRQMAATMTASAIAAAASPTPVVVFFTATPVTETATPDPVTETVAALYTQAALAELTVFPTTTALGGVPTTGFADEVGLPGLFIIGFVLIVIILLARRLRSAPAR
jgi:hypothetical protein